MENPPASIASVSSSSGMTRYERKVVMGASLGTIFEFYDFALFGVLSAVIALHYFGSLSPNLAFIFTLLTFAAAFVARPLGAVVFGRIGDLVGRKHTFIVTVAAMGAATIMVGLLPSYASWGIAAPILLMLIRIMQGIAVGGEFGGAASYVAEHAPPGRLGYFTAWIQICASAGVALSLFVTASVRWTMGNSDFTAWGWRIPFLLSVILLGASLWIRARLNESPVYQRMKSAGKTTRTPLKDIYGSWQNFKRQLATLFGPLAAASVLGVLALVYLILFLIKTLHVDPTTVNWIYGTAILAALPIFPLMGWLSDRIGRKPIVITACLMATFTIFPVIKLLTHYANPDYERALNTTPIQVSVDPSECSGIFNSTRTAQFLSSCDIIKSILSKEGVNYSNSASPAGKLAQVHIGSVTIDSFDAHLLTAGELASRTAALTKQIRSAIRLAGYPVSADMTKFNGAMVWLIVFYIMVLFAMSQSVNAAILVELFPASIRYTAISIPYHLSTVIAGFFVPIGFALSNYTGNIYFGLWYPVLWAAIGALVCLLAIPETKGKSLENWF